LPQSFHTVLPGPEIHAPESPLWLMFDGKMSLPSI